MSIPNPEGHEIYNLIDPSLVKTMHLVCLHLKLFTPNYRPLGWGFIKFTISCILIIQTLYTKFSKDWPCSSGAIAYAELSFVPHILLCMGLWSKF